MKYRWQICCGNHLPAISGSIKNKEQEQILRPEWRNKIGTEKQLGTPWADGPINAAQVAAGHRSAEKSRQTWPAPRRTEKNKKQSESTKINRRRKTPDQEKWQNWTAQRHQRLAKTRNGHCRRAQIWARTERRKSNRELGK
jgi:hypothetical protein